MPALPLGCVQVVRRVESDQVGTLGPRVDQGLLDTGSLGRALPARVVHAAGAHRDDAGELVVERRDVDGAGTDLDALALLPVGGLAVFHHLGGGELVRGVDGDDAGVRQVSGQVDPHDAFPVAEQTGPVVGPQLHGVLEHRGPVEPSGPRRELGEGLERLPGRGALVRPAQVGTGQVVRLVLVDVGRPVAEQDPPAPARHLVPGLLVHHPRHRRHEVGDGLERVELEHRRQVGGTVRAHPRRRTPAGGVVDLLPARRRLAEILDGAVAAGPRRAGHGCRALGNENVRLAAERVHLLAVARPAVTERDLDLDRVAGPVQRPFAVEPVLDTDLASEVLDVLGVVLAVDVGVARLVVLDP